MQIAPGLHGDEWYAANGGFDVLVDPAAGGTALKSSLPALSWGEIGGSLTLPVGEVVYLCLYGARLGDSAMNLVFDEKIPELGCLNRLWGAMVTAGLEFGNERIAPSAALHKLMDAAVKADSAAMTLNAVDFMDTQARPIPPANVVVIAAAAAPGMPPAANTFAAAPPWQEVAIHLRWGDLVRPDRRLTAAAHLEYVLHRRVRTQHREPGTIAAKAWVAIIRAVHGGASGNENALLGLSDDDYAAAVGGALLHAVWPPMLRDFHTRPATRRAEYGAAIKAKGSPPETKAIDALACALGSGELPWLAEYIDVDAAPSSIASAILELAPIVGVAVTTISEASLRQMERGISALKYTTDAAGSPAARVAALAEKVAARKLAVDSAPKGEAGGRETHAMVDSHARSQQPKLQEVYETPNFAQQAASLVRMECPLGVLFLALTGGFLAGIGEPGGPRDKVEADLARCWTPVPVFHQVIWGKVSSLAGKDELRKLATHRIHMPRLLGLLASRKLAGIDEAGAERMAALRLDAFWAQLRAKEWRGKLDFVNSMLVPVLAAFHDAPLASQPHLPAPARYDVAILRALLPMLAEVMQVATIPKTGRVSFHAIFQPVFDIVALHSPAADPVQAALIQAAISEYIETTLEEFVMALNPTRLEADAAATFSAALGGGHGLVQFNQTLRSLNSAAARRRAGEGGSGGGLIALPRTTHGLPITPNPALRPPLHVVRHDVEQKRRRILAANLQYLEPRLVALRTLRR